MAGSRTTKRAGKGTGVRQVVATALTMVGVLTLLPVLFLTGDPVYSRETGSGGAASEPTLPIDRAVTVQATRDKGRAVRLQKADGTVEELTMAEYLWGVVAAEMPAAFEAEALKAQACAARTYAVTVASGKHPGADICADSHCCQAYVERSAAQARWGLNAEAYGEKIDRAVAETDGLGVLYQGTPIQALFFSSAPGKTVDAVEVWGRSVDYLKSVDSPEGEEVPNYRTQVVMTKAQVKEAVLAAYPGADLSGDPGKWFGEARRSGGGTVSSILLGGITLTGGQVRSLFSLRSAAFAVDWGGENFTFDVTGYGHGVGMSQYGADALAKEGKNFREILTWYYTGTSVEHLW